MQWIPLTSPISQMRKLRSREIKKPDHGLVLWLRAQLLEWKRSGLQSRLVHLPAVFGDGFGSFSILNNNNNNNDQSS